METNWIVTDKDNKGEINQECLTVAHSLTEINKEIDDDDVHIDHACRETEHKFQKQTKRKREDL